MYTAPHNGYNHLQMQPVNVIFAFLKIKAIHFKGVLKVVICRPDKEIKIKCIIQSKSIK